MAYFNTLLVLPAVLVAACGACFVPYDLVGKWQLQTHQNYQIVPVGSLDISESSFKVQYDGRNSTFVCSDTDYDGTYLFASHDGQGLICVQWFPGDGVSDVVMIRLNLQTDQSVDDFFSPTYIPDGFTPTIANSCHDSNVEMLYMKYTP